MFKWIHNKIDRWLHKEEIELAQHMREQGIDPVEMARQAQGPSEEEMKAEFERMERIAQAEIEKIRAENHAQPPSQADINRYYQYHENFVYNIKKIVEKTGQRPPFEVPSEPMRFEPYCEGAKEQGWEFLRSSCNLPMGDPTVPRKPWTMGDGDKRWTLNDSQQAWSSKNEEEPEKPKIRKRGI